MPKLAAKNKTSEMRASIMRSVKSCHTKPEIFVRKGLYRLGFHFRLHRKELPGKPDISLPKFKVAIRVMGCFWHGHSCKRGRRVPKTNQRYWVTKIARNRARDAAQKSSLKILGWRVIDVWECRLRDEDFFLQLSSQIRHN